MSPSRVRNAGVHPPVPAPFPSCSVNALQSFRDYSASYAVVRDPFRDVRRDIVTFLILSIPFHSARAIRARRRAVVAEVLSQTGKQTSRSFAEARHIKSRVLRCIVNGAIFARLLVDNATRSAERPRRCGRSMLVRSRTRRPRWTDFDGNKGKTSSVSVGEPPRPILKTAKPFWCRDAMVGEDFFWRGFVFTQ